MKSATANRALLALVLVATLFGFAPLFHAVCVGEDANQTTTNASHVMADGTIMNMSAGASVDLSKFETMDALAQPAELKQSGSSGSTDLLGCALLTVGIALFVAMCIRVFKKSRSVRSALPITSLLRSLRLDILFRLAKPPSALSLAQLSISRT